MLPVVKIMKGEQMLGSVYSYFNHPLYLLAIFITFLMSLFITMSFHEFAHAHAALKEGDVTAKVLGRYTLAPFAHIDVTGLVFLLLFGIGFAKPVPVDSRNFKRGVRSQLRVAFAGVLVNILIGVVACFLYAFLVNVWSALFNNYGFVSMLYETFFSFLISLNFMFAFFNILPIYPLDGFRVVEALSKTENGYIRFMRRYSFWIILILLITDLLGLYINFFAYGLADLVLTGFDKLFALMV